MNLKVNRNHKALTLGSGSKKLLFWLRMLHYLAIGTNSDIAMVKWFLSRISLSFLLILSLLLQEHRWIWIQQDRTPHRAIMLSIGHFSFFDMGVGWYRLSDQIRVYIHVLWVSHFGLRLLSQRHSRLHIIATCRSQHGQKCSLETHIGRRRGVIYFGRVWLHHHRLHIWLLLILSELASPRSFTGSILNKFTVVIGSAIVITLQ